MNAIRTIYMNVKFDDKPWITKTLKNSIWQNRNYYDIFIPTILKSDNRYKLYENKLVTVLIKIDWKIVLYDELKNDTKGTWAVLNKTINKS